MSTFQDERVTGPADTSTRPVCAGLMSRDMVFFPIAYHPHPPDEGICRGSVSGTNVRTSDRCPIRTYVSCHEVDGRFDGQFITDMHELVVAARAMQGAINGQFKVVMPVAFAKWAYGYTDADFSEEIASYG